MQHENVPHKSSIGDMDANILALLTYLVPLSLNFIPNLGYISWLIPLLVYLFEKKSDFVRFHAMQSLVLRVCGFVLTLLMLTIILTIPALILLIVLAVFGIIAMVKSYKYVEYGIPVVGGLARNYAKPLR